MGRFIDMSGKRYGHLTAITVAGLDKNNLYMWRFKCDCGNYTIQRGQDVRRGKVVSCGCWKNQQTTARNKKHGMSGTRPYRIWTGMKTRCYNPKAKSYADYGGRGIKMCSGWKECFQNFWTDMQNGYDDEKEIDRIDPNGDYCPENCRWVTKTEQNRNTRANCVLQTPWGPLCLTAAAEKSGIPKGTLKDRIKRGVAPSDLFLPAIKRGPKANAS